tara:strand:- start:733 stop:891 length:159 start_codon:yes stop_codon:yes gene_type:complete
MKWFTKIRPQVLLIITIFGTIGIAALFLGWDKVTYATLTGLAALSKDLMRDD